MATATLALGGRGPISNLPGSPRHSALLRKGRTKVSVRLESQTSLEKTPEEDPLRILAPGQKKLTTVESQRVLAVVDDTSRRLESALTLPFLSDSLERFSVSLGAELVSAIGEYRRLSTEYTALYRQLDVQGLSPRADDSTHLVQGQRERECSPSPSSADVSGRSRRLKPLGEAEDPPPEQRFHQVRQELRHCIKSILRDLSTNSSTSALLQAGPRERTQAATHLLDSVTSLRRVVNEKLLTTSSEDKSREKHLRRVVERQKDSEEQIRKLEAELKLAQENMEQEASQFFLVATRRKAGKPGDEATNVRLRNSQIARFESDLNTVEKMAQDAKRRVENDAAQQQSLSKQAHETTTTELKESIAGLKKSLQEKVGANREKEQEFRKRVFKRETEVDNWIQKYDQEMGEKQDELETLETEFEEEKQQLKELEERLGVLSIEYDAVVKEQEETRKAAEEAEREKKLMTRAATSIQRYWKAYRERTKAEREARKGKKGKKGKGKGKGKGKKKK